MAYISYSEHGENPLTKLLGHNPKLLENWMALLESYYSSCELDRKLMEEVRRTIAYQIGCAYCMSHGCPTHLIEDMKTLTAVEFARKVVQTQREITEQDIAPLKGYFSEREIAELCAFICYGIGLARFGAVLNVDVSLSEALQGKS
ncbi:MAG: carboxymuconolactone decarboxylase family protein [Verrucomicrobia bacterium]|nr:carboxymuconolactone decarboxylase family protein [Verrucomicrobiota bacterium]